MEGGHLCVKVFKAGASDSVGVGWDDGAKGEPKEMFISYGKAINTIQTVYQYGGTRLLSKKHGRRDGDKFASIRLSGPITALSGHYEKKDVDGKKECVIRSLKIATRSATHGPYGAEEGTPFWFRFGGGIVGLHGRSSDQCLCAIGVYIRTTADHTIDSAHLVPASAPALGRVAYRTALETLPLVVGCFMVIMGALMGCGTPYQRR